MNLNQTEKSAGVSGNFLQPSASNLEFPETLPPPTPLPPAPLLKPLRRNNTLAVLTDPQLGQRLALQTRTFEFDAAREALIHAAKLIDILKDTTLDNQQKIWKSRQILFPRSQDTIHSESTGTCRPA